MKILLTAQPKTGKSTVIGNFLKNFKGEVSGVITLRMKDHTGVNQGFLSQSVYTKESKIIAHKTKVSSPYMVGNHHHVDLDAIDSFIVPEISKGFHLGNSVIILDEIGTMQSFSKRFIETTRKIINSDFNLLGTILYSNEPFAREFKKSPNVVLVEVTIKNRDILPSLLVLIFENASILKDLSVAQNTLILNMLRSYFKQNNVIQIKKLFNNAIHYILEKKISKTEDGYKVNGNTNQHNVKINPDSCDCDLFNGSGEYQEKAGECSHIQAVKLFTQ